MTMPIKTPFFWYRDKHSPASRGEKLLSPLSALYRMGRKIHENFEQPKAVTKPVICVGNINAGGSGKTPAALALMSVIKRHNLADMPWFLSRGYGGSNNIALVVHPASHSYHQTGEEALLLAAQASTMICPNRFKGASEAINHGADLILMDDGLQNRSLLRDLNFVIVDGSMGFGNQKPLPAGPLRQGLEDGFNEADAFILIGEDRRKIAASLPVDTPLFRAHLKIDEARAPEKSQKYIAFAGLGYPQKFFNTLNENGYNIVQTQAFADHHAYSAEDLDKLYKNAIERDAQLLTTEKDYMRLPEDYKDRTQVLPVYLSFENEPALVQFLSGSLKAIKKKAKA